MKQQYRGNEIFEWNGRWYYFDDSKPVEHDKNRACGYCHRANTDEGHDGCLGRLHNVMNACCGHGVIGDAYVQLNSGLIFHGPDAMKFLDKTSLYKD